MSNAVQTEEERPLPHADAMRLVRLRVGLAMTAMAILPLALVAVTVPLLAGPGKDAEAQVAAASSGVSAALAAELGRVRSAALIVAADPGNAALVAGRGGAGPDARAGLSSIASVLGPLVPSATIIDRTGAPRLAVQGGRLVAAPAVAHPDDPLLAAVRGLTRGSVYRSVPYAGPGGDPRVTLATPILSGSGAFVGLVRFDLSLRQALLASVAGAVTGQGYALITDRQDGHVLADTRSATTTPSSTPVQAGVLPDLGGVISTAVSRAGRAWSTLFGDGWGVGLSPVSTAVPGFGDWTVVVAQPLPAGGPPLALLATAALLITAIALMAAWMARQVLRPAAELERSRGELAQLYETARRDALVDPLTGLGNHRAFQETFGRELEQARRHGHPVALMLLDLDDFKGVNDNRGHAAGDAVLATFGGIVTGAIRRGDAAFRIGGDEFAVVMPHTEADGAEIVARRLLVTALEPTPGRDPRSSSAGQGTAVGTSFSAGIAAAPAHGTVVGELMARADAALYWGKRHGRTAIEVYDSSRHRAELAASVGDLDAAVQAVVRGRLVRPVFQPIVSLEDGRLLGYEGLIRPLPEAGFADAASLFLAAEATGRVTDLDRVCVEVVANGAAGVPPDAFVSLNLTPRSLEAPDFSVGALRALLARAGLAATRVVLEITERQEIQALERLRENLDACRRAGFRIAADDIGAGNAGLQLLSHVRFDMVKIDLALVHEGALHDPALSVLRSLVELAGRWGATIVAEGIESSQQLRAMRALQVSAAQGYLLGRPGELPERSVPVDLETLAEDGGAWPATAPWLTSRPASAPGT